MTTETQLDLGLPPAGRRRSHRSPDRDREFRPRPVHLPDHEIRTEHQLVQILAEGVYHLDDIVDAAERAGLADRANGRGHRNCGDVIYRHRVRAALDARRRRRPGRPLRHDPAAAGLAGARAQHYDRH
jgi:hypothetical protein